MIAISYRREDSLPVTGRLYDRLQAHFGKDQVFMDFDSIPAGLDFREQIEQTIDRTDVVIAVIGLHWLGAKSDASRRIDDAADFVRLEIARALKRGIPLIPVLVDDAPMPKPESLPADIQELAFRNALPLDSGIDFHSHAERLINSIHRLLPAADVATKSERAKLNLPLEARKTGRSRKTILLGSIASLVAFALAIAVWFFVRAHPEESVESRKKSISEQRKPRIPIDRYRELNGTWLIFEQVNKDHGGWEIIWSYAASVSGSQLAMHGKKTTVNEPGSAAPRELAPGEKATVSVYSLTLAGLEAEGTSDEQDPNGHVYSALKLQFSEDLKSLSGTLKTGGADVSTLYGSKQ